MQTELTRLETTMLGLMVACYSFPLRVRQLLSQYLYLRHALLQF